MVNPIAPAFNWFLGLWNAIPQPIQAIIYLSVGLFVILAIIGYVFR